MTVARLLDWQRFKNNKRNWLRFLFVVKVTALIQQNINILSTRYKHRSPLPHLYQSVAWRLPSLVLIFCFFLVIYSKFRRNFIVQGFWSVRGGGRNLPFPTTFAVSWYYGTSGDIGDGVRSCVSQISRYLLCACVLCYSGCGEASESRPRAADYTSLTSLTGLPALCKSPPVRLGNFSHSALVSDKSWANRPWWTVWAQLRGWCSVV